MSRAAPGKLRGPLFGLRASGKLGGHRRGAYARRSLTFYPSVDGFIRGIPEVSQSHNYARGLSLRVGAVYAGSEKGSLDRLLVVVDLSSVVGRTFSRCTFSRYIHTITGPPVEQLWSRCTRTSQISQPSVTWLNYASGSPWTSPGGDYDDTGPPQSFSSSPAVAGQFHELEIPLAHLEYALESAAGFLSLLCRLPDETPETDTLTVSQASESPSPSQRPFFTLYP